MKTIPTPGYPDASLVYRSFGLAIAFFASFSAFASPSKGVLLINSLHHPFFDLIFPALTVLGNGAIMIPFLVILCFRKIYLAIALIVSGIAEGIIVTILKRGLFSSSGRPMSILDPALVHFTPGVDVHQSMSFPSGHSVTIFGVCVFLALVFRKPKITLFLVLLSTMVALSRVYLLQHFFIDVFAGAVIGTVIGISTFSVFEVIKKPSWMHHRLAITLAPNKSDPGFS